MPNFNKTIFDTEIEKFNKNIYMTKNINPIEHVNYFTGKNFFKLIEDCGYKIIDNDKLKFKQLKQKNIKELVYEKIISNTNNSKPEFFAIKK